MTDLRGAPIGSPKWLASASARLERYRDESAPDACWPWRGPVTGKGYGRASVCARNQFAHRIAWIITNGPIPDGLLVCHRCDNPPCCNPAHLFLGSAADNLWDMAVKGRAGKKKLTDDQVREIRASTEHTHLLARRYGVNDSNIYYIRKGVYRRAVPGPPAVVPQHLRDYTALCQEIRARYEGGESSYDLALAYGSSAAGIRKRIRMAGGTLRSMSEARRLHLQREQMAA